MKLHYVLAAACLLVACGKSLDGTYSGTMGSFEFERDGKVTVEILGMERQLAYRIDGNKVLIGGAEGGDGGDMVLRIQDDGSLSGMGQTLIKKK